MIAKILLASNIPTRLEEINKILKDYGLSNPHPDLLYFPQDSKLGIGEARKIKAHFSLKPYSAKGRAVVLEDASKLTLEAQNALLKTLEEPPPGALLILGAPTDAKFLPTILSRCQVIRVQSAECRVQSSELEKDIERLLEANTEERFEYIEKLKDKEEFLRALVWYFHQALATHPTTHPATHPGGVKLDFLKELLQAEEWTEANVNIRAILEYLMLKMPKTD